MDLCGLPPASTSAFGWSASQFILSGIVLTFYFTRSYKTSPHVAPHIPHIVILLSLLSLSTTLLMRVITTDWYCGELAAVMYLALGFFVGGVFTRQLYLINEAALIKCPGKHMFPPKLRITLFFLIMVVHGGAGFYNLSTIPDAMLCKNPFGGSAPVALFVIYCVVWILCLGLLLQFRKTLLVFVLEWSIFGSLIFAFVGASVIIAYRDLENPYPLLTGADAVFNLMSLFLLLCQFFLATPYFFEKAERFALFGRMPDRRIPTSIEMETQNLAAAEAILDELKDAEAEILVARSVATKQNDPLNLGAHRQLLFLSVAWGELPDHVRNNFIGLPFNPVPVDSETAKLRHAFQELLKAKQTKWIDSTGIGEFVVALQLCLEALEPRTKDERHVAIYHQLITPLVEHCPRWFPVKIHAEFCRKQPKPYQRDVANESFESLRLIFEQYIHAAQIMDSKK